MQPASVEKLIWVLIFGGMIVFTLGLFMLRGGGGALAWVFMGAAVVAAALGVVLIFVRARMRAPLDDKP